MTVSKWTDAYLELPEVKAKRSHDRDRQLVKPIQRILGPVPLADVRRDDVVRFIAQRRTERIIRNGKDAKTTVSLGTIANEVSCLRAMLYAAFVHKDDKHETNGLREPKFPELASFRVNFSFKGLIQRGERERILSPEEETKLLEAYLTWMKRIAIVAVETCLSEGDIMHQRYVNLKGGDV